MTRGSWSSPELMRLRELFPRTTTERVARLLGRSVEAVIRRAQQMFCRETQTGQWTVGDDDLLRRGHGVHDVATLAMIVARTPQDVISRLEEFRAELRSGRWNDDEVALLKDLYGTRSADELATCLSRSTADIAAKAVELCLAKDKAARLPGDTIRMPRWTAAEIARLRELYSNQENVEIARQLGRSVASVANKACQLGLGKGRPALRRMGRANLARRRRD